MENHKILMPKKAQQTHKQRNKGKKKLTHNCFFTPTCFLKLRVFSHPYTNNWTEAIEFSAKFTWLHHFSKSSRPH
jgi:hypothetical protein